MHKIEGINLIRTNYEEPQPGIRVTPDATEANHEIDECAEICHVLDSTFYNITNMDSCE